MSLERIIHSDNFTDANGELHYLNTGRDNVSGLPYHNHYINNKDNYLYTRILKINLSTDTSLIYPIHECFLMTTYNNDNVSGITNIITVDAIVKNSTVTSSNIKVTCSPLNYMSGIVGGQIHNIKAALRAELTGDGETITTLGIWLNTKDILDIVIKELSVLSYNNIPNNIYHQFLQCDYQANYLDNEDVIHEVNTFNYEPSIGTDIATGMNVNQLLIDKIKSIDESVKTAVPDYKYLSVIYDDMYSIGNINVDETIKPTAFQYIQTDNSFATINNDYVQVNSNGNYLIALKVNMDIKEGNPTNMELSLFLNDDKLEETAFSMYLNPSNKEHPIGFLAGQVQIQLKSSDKLYLKARWTEKENVNIENHCTLQITKLNEII